MSMNRGQGRDKNFKAIPKKGVNHLLLIGIDAYQHWQKLSNAVKDAKDFKEVLLSQYQFKEEHLISLFNEEATEANIYQAFRDIKNRLKAEDNLIIYYSGHGHHDSDFDEGFWIPSDASRDNESSFISNANIIKRINALNTQHTFIIVDSCFSGSLIVQKRSSFADEAYKSRRILASCRYETASDGIAGENSPFAKALLVALRKNTQPRLDAGSLIRQVKDMVYTWAKQEPVDGRISNSPDEGGEFVFHLQRNEEAIWEEVDKTNTVEAYRNYLAGFPQGRYADAANKKIDVLEEDSVWKTASTNDNESAYDNYIKRYTPTGKYLALAIEKRDQLKHNREERQKARHALSQKESEREAMRTEFQGLINSAEQLYQDRQLEAAKNKYRAALDLHMPGFAPTQNYIEDQINFCQTNMTFLRHYEHGKSAMNNNNYRLAIEYFQEALKVRNNAKVEELIRHCQLKLKAQKSSSNRGASTTAASTQQRYTANTSNTVSNKKGPLFWSLVVIGGIVAIIFTLGVIGIMAGANENDFSADEPLQEAVEILDEDTKDSDPAPPSKKLAPPSNAQQILGSWQVRQVLVNGQDLLQVYPQMSAIIGTTYEFYNNNTVQERNTDGSILNHPYTIEGSSIYIASPGYGIGIIDYLDEEELKITLPFSADGMNQFNFSFIMER